MSLKIMADEFLQNVKAKRDSAVARAVEQEIQTKHEPYKAQMIAARDKALATEEQAYNAVIAQLRKEHEAKKATCIADFEKAISDHRNEVARVAEATVRCEYDKFIYGVCAVADEIKEN